MRNKVLKLICLMLLGFVGTFGLVSCESGGNTPGEGDQSNGDTTPTPQNSITISYVSEYGTLSFESKNYELENGSVYLDSEDLPVITGEGDVRIFDKWLNEDNTEFLIENPITKNITLYASFVDAELVWTEKWQLYDSSYSLYDEISFNVDRGMDYNKYENDRFPCMNILSGINPTFTKIRKSDCLNDYITKTEYSKIAGIYCFVTSSNGKTKFVTENDITTDVYQYYVDMIIGNENFGYCSVGCLPKGVNLYNYELLGTNFSLEANPRKGTFVNRLLKYFVQTKSLDKNINVASKSGIDLKTSKHFIVSSMDDMKNYTLASIREACNDESYTCTYDFNNDSPYIAYLCVDYIYCYDYDMDTDTEHFSFIATDWNNTESTTTLTKIGCTREEFDEFKTHYLTNFEYKKSN